MKHQQPLRFITSTLCAVALLLSPLGALAEGNLEVAEDAFPVIITEVQTGGATASEEFVELYNTSSQPVDITGWQVRYAAAGATPDVTTLLATVAGDGDTPIILPGHEYYVLHSSVVTLPTDVSGQVYAASLSKTDKTIALFARDEATCQMNVQDAVAWESVPGTTLGEGTAVAAGVMTNVDKLVQRYLDVSGQYVDTDNNAHDFLLVQGTPGRDNSVPVAASEDVEGSASSLTSFAASNCTVPSPSEPPEDPADPPIPQPDPEPEPPAPEDPPAEDPPSPDPEPSPPQPNEGLTAPEITEILPNPAPPHTDADDEYIELYNPNNEVFDLSGYMLEAGLTTTYRYTFPEGSTLEAQSYKAFFSADTHITLSNASGQVRLKDAAGAVVYESASYTTAGNDQAWASIQSTWQWTAIITPNAANASGPEPEEEPNEEETPPPADPIPSPEPPATPDNNVGLLAPQITELLPNPAAPQTDQQDEFIEIFNPNDSTFDLKNYVLETGLTSKYRYTFPEGTVLPPKSFTAFFSADTGLTLSNTSGQAGLIDPSGTTIAESGVYGTAKDDQAWIFIDGLWQWTTSLTPHAANALTAPAVKEKKSAASTTSKKKTATKGVQTKNSSTKQDKDEEESLLGVTKPSDPLHPGMLAAVGVFAILYGAYEYRNDVASRIRQFRANRTAGAAVGAGAKRR